MVIKGKARGGASALAVHLERRDTNEVVRVMELRGVTSRDVRGALREMDCMGSGAASVRTLYHAAINTAPGERLTDEQKRQAADRLEKELGFEGQPRIMVEHLKKDREHMHVVFMRIDTERMVAIPDSHNYRKHEIVARDLEREFGHQVVPGAHVDREGKDRPARTPGHDEMQQAERSGFTPQQAKEQVTRLWNQADSGKAFAGAVAAEGWILAKGDKRDFVLVDQAGETHSLARRIEGAKAADVRQRMADVDQDSLPSVTDAKALQKTTTNERGKQKEKEKAKEPAKDPILLRVETPFHHDPAKPLRPQERRPEPAKAAKPIHTIEARGSQGPKAQKEREPKPEPTKLQKLYTATQRALGRARSVFEKKMPLVKAEKAKAAPARSQEAPRLKEKPAARVPKPEPTQVLKPTPAPPAPKSKKRMTPEELDEMIGRQRQQREDRSGPSR